MLVTRERQILCGKDYKEVDIIKAFTNKKLNGRGKKKELSSPKQKNLNDKRAWRYLCQLINTNFADMSDYLLHLTFKEEFLPSSVEEGEALVKNYMRRLNYRLRKAGKENCKYIIIPSVTSSKTGEIVRLHFHIILSCDLERAEILGQWKYGRKNLNELQGEEDKYQKLCEYLKKNFKSGRRWISSLNLKKPEEKMPNDMKYTGRQIEKIAKAPVDIDFWERKYPGWTLISCDDAYQVEYNEFTGWSIYLKLRRKVQRVKL